MKTCFKFICFAFSAVLILGATVTSAGENNTFTGWHEGYNGYIEASKKADAEDKFLLLYFYTDW